jgi:N6-L-threonylcarbamoyladenine synthase
MLILGIESSCDETSCSVVEDGEKILSNVVSSQVKVHSPYGGVVPELASREHIKNILPVLDQSLKDAGTKLKDIHAIAVTVGPGLIGSLLVGLETAKALAYATQKPLVGIHHVAAHLYSVFLEHELDLDTPRPCHPYLGLVVSGGHTSIVIVESPLDYRQVGQTLDDAAGEAYDKVAKLLDLGYPGGPIIEKLAKSGDPRRIDFPRPNIGADDFNFSFSGLKTAVVNYVRKNGLYQIKQDEQWLYDVCASFQMAVIDSLINKVEKAARHFLLTQIVIAGGVASNGALRKAAKDRCPTYDVIIPKPALCTDNAAMVAGLGFHYFRDGRIIDLVSNAYSRLKI